MANYLLLRNNKESGPYTTEDLLSLGLKAYDLVWIQGKSAAWRYPSEVEELKAFAPIVEEQPFDRFFKKQSDEKKEEAPKQEIPVAAPEHEKYIPQKSVYVTMPGQKNTVAKTPIKEETLPSTPVQPTITVSENPATAKVKYAQPLDEIKEMYVKTLHERKQKIARKGFWLQSLKKAAALLLLVAVGVIAGFILKSNNGKEQAAVQKPSKTQTVKSTSPITEQDTNSTASEIKTLPAPSGEFANKEVLEQKRPAEVKQPIDKLPNSNVKKDIPSAQPGNEIKNSLVTQGVEINPVNGERIRKFRTGNEGNIKATNSEERSNSFNELSGLVSVISNDYKKVAFGGIRDLQLTVTNDSKYILDNVIVELQYIKPNELPLRTENIHFTSIGPKSTSTIRVPDTNRGIKVVYRIVSIKKHQQDEEVAGN